MTNGTFLLLILALTCLGLGIVNAFSPEFLSIMLAFSKTLVLKALLLT